MQELIDKKVAAREGDHLYEGILKGWTSRGPWEFHILENARYINHQSSSDPHTKMDAGMNWYPVPGRLYLPVGPTTIHRSHLKE